MKHRRGITPKRVACAGLGYFPRGFLEFVIYFVPETGIVIFRVVRFNYFYKPAIAISQKITPQIVEGADDFRRAEFVTLLLKYSAMSRRLRGRLTTAVIFSTQSSTSTRGLPAGSRDTLRLPTAGSGFAVFQHYAAVAMRIDSVLAAYNSRTARLRAGRQNPTVSFPPVSRPPSVPS